MKILFLHGWQSTPGGRKPTYLKDHGHTVLNPALPEDNFEQAVAIAQAEYDQGHPDVVVGSSRGGAVAMNIDSGTTPLFLLCPAWKKRGTATTVKPNTTILHSRADETVPFADSEELVKNSGLPSSALIDVGTEHRLADAGSLAMMAGVVEAATPSSPLGSTTVREGVLMADDSDPQMALMFSFYEGVVRKGPGSEASTRKALSMPNGMPPKPRIVDLGCGAGAASLVLATATQGNVTAVDIHQPFLQQLEALSANEGLTDGIRTVEADMADPPFPDGSFDLVWSEGAVYIVGFEQGLKRWRRLLRAGGFVAVTEVSWLCETPPRKAVDFWTTEYPAMTSIEDNLTKVRSAGFEPVGHFILPSEDWENYYGPVQDQLAVFRSENSDNAEAQALADSLQREIDVWKEYGSSYGYVFYLGRAI